MSVLPKTNNRGFTLVEMLVVITIIGLLASMVLAALTVTRERARDTQRMQTVKELQKVLELYRNTYGHYPCADGTLCWFDPAFPNSNGNAGRIVRVNGTTRTYSPPNNFDTVISPYIRIPNETIAFADDPNPSVSITNGSISYLLGPNHAARVKDSYVILLRREKAVTNLAGVTIPAGTTCVIRVGPNTNFSVAPPTLPNCY